MLRFLLGGLATVAGLVLLFIASFGDPAIVLNRFDAVLSMISPGHAPAGTADNAVGNAPAGAPSAHAVAVMPPSQSQSPPLPVAPSQPQPAPPPQVQANQGPSASPPPPAQPPSPAVPDRAAADQAAALSAQRAALQQQLQQLQTEMTQASQSVSSLHSQADQERQSLDTLQRQRAAAEAQVSQLDARREHDAREHDARAHDAAQVAQPQPPSPEASPVLEANPAPEATQASGAKPAPEATPEPQQAGAPAPAQVAQSAQSPAPLPLPPPLPSDPPQQTQPTAAAAAPPPSQAAASPPPQAAAPLPSQAAAPPPPQAATQAVATNGGRLAAARPERDRSQHPVQSDAGATRTVLDRLRQTPAAAPQAASPGPDVVARSDDQSPPRSAEASYDQPRQIAPRARLGMARAALEAGRVEDARQFLEEAQLQLVFRPVTPNSDDAPGASRVAGDVASALSMLGAGNTNGALAYVARAMGDTRPSGAPPSQGYGYGRPFGGAPVADAGR